MDVLVAVDAPEEARYAGRQTTVTAMFKLPCECSNCHCNGYPVEVRAFDLYGYHATKMVVGHGHVFKFKVWIMISLPVPYRLLDI